MQIGRETMNLRRTRIMEVLRNDHHDQNRNQIKSKKMKSHEKRSKTMKKITV